MIYEIIQQNFVGVVIVFFLILFILTNSNFDRKANRLFLASIICVLVLIIEEAWEAQLARAETLSNMRVLLSAIGYTLRPMTAYFLVVLSHRSTRKWSILMSIPIVLNMVTAFSALFGGWAFGYTASNEFVRGPLGIVPFLTAAFYVLTLLFIAMRDRRKGGMTETMTVMAIVLLTVVATTMESVFHFRAIQSACSAISITFYYLFLHTNQTNRDPLTGAMTRRRFYRDADKYRVVLSAVISLDLNNLKTLNDQFGHVEGDRALITVTNTIKSCITKNTPLYRIGGDEFMILCYKLSEKEVQALIQKIQKKLELTKYRCAMGYALYSYRAELDQVCQNADSAMYANKLQMKNDGGST